jgi:hypothetical protein
MAYKQSDFEAYVAAYIAAIGSRNYSAARVAIAQARAVATDLASKVEDNGSTAEFDYKAQIDGWSKDLDALIAQDTSTGGAAVAYVGSVEDMI